ncbi:ATP-dependent DNA helicase [Corynebacterium sp. Q4381]|uniref:ATP-dependent DNA helicase n=1 Tax=Corynebacterium sp. Marseille-Q4381 TaxID=3121597 RepID=UPI002FE5598F
MSSPDIPSIPAAVTPRAYLVPRTRSAQARQWGRNLPAEGMWKITGEAGSGVSSFLIDTAAAAASRGSVLVISSSKESGARLRAELSDLLAASGYVADEPMVRSVHSLAFALLRQRTEQEIRLISGAEQDAVIRQLLQGHAEDGGGSWPEELRPALPMVGFARQLRDFLLRAAERNLEPEDLERLGGQHGIPIWAAAGDFQREYRQVMSLTGALRFSAAELVGEVLKGELTEHWDTVIVDDAQHLSPASAELVKRLLQRATLGVVGGDAEQSVFRFRGASPKFYADLGGLEHGVIDLGASKRTPARSVAVAPDEQTHHAAIVDTIRRAHLEGGEAYSSMAVIVRSTPMIEPVRRALLHAGVPVALDPTDVVLSQQRIVVALLLGLRALEEDLQPSQWRDLILGPVGGSDPVTLRRLLRGLRRLQPAQRAEETLQDLLSRDAETPDFGGVLTEREIDILTRMRSVLDAGRGVLDAGGSVEEVLWAIWEATGLSGRLSAAALRGGATGSQADRDLDAAMALFDAAGDFTERRPSAGIGLFIQFIEEQELPTGVRDRRTAKPDAVSLMTAHGAAGREFERVVVAGVQELTWPSLGETGTMFRQEDLIDLVDAGVDPAVPVPRSAERLVEERRLFYLATTRATKHLLVTAVDDQESDEVTLPSRFVEEFAAEHGVEVRRVAAAGEVSEVLTSGSAYVVRTLSRDDVVAELRRALQDPDCPSEAHEQAARQLARLADAGVAGASADEWWGIGGASTSEALPKRTSLSPSRIEGLLECPMRVVLEQMVELDETMHMVKGLLAHAYFEALGRGIERDKAREIAVAARGQMEDGPAWKAGRDLEDFERMLSKIDGWLDVSQANRNALAVEAEVDVRVGPELRIRGRSDRLEVDGEGRVRIVDLKSGTSAPTKEQAQENAQLMAYQLAVRNGVLDGESVVSGDGDGLEIDSAVLLYPASTTKTAKVLEQSAKTDEELDAFANLIQPLPGAMTGPALTAQTGPHCEYCKVRALCPVQPEGTVITDA